MTAEPRTNVLETARALGSGQAGAVHGRVRRPVVAVEIATPERFLELEAAWRDLVARALVTNAFMEPVLVAAAAGALGEPVHVALAWECVPGVANSRLLGAWAFRACRLSSAYRATVLKAPVHDHAALGTPVIDREWPAFVLEELLGAIEDAPDLPNIVCVDAMHRSGPIGEAVRQALLARRTQVFPLDPRMRPRLEVRSEPSPPSRSRVKALRQKRRRLADLGEVSFTSETEPADVERALEAFLALEAAGWKGRGRRRGQAILRRPVAAALFRTALVPLAARGLAAFATLRLSGRPVAMQLTVLSGRTAFTWKTAYDETLKSCCPGLLLLQDVTASFQASAAIDDVDSCNHRDDGYMAEFWSDRLDLADVVFDVRPGTSIAGCLAGGSQYVLWWLKRRARAARTALRRHRQGRRGLDAGRASAPAEP